MKISIKNIALYNLSEDARLAYLDIYNSYDAIVETDVSAHTLEGYEKRANGVRIDVLGTICGIAAAEGKTPEWIQAASAWANYEYQRVISTMRAKNTLQRGMRE